MELEPKELENKWN